MGEVVVLSGCVGTFELCHPFEETQEVRTSVVGRIDLLVAEFAKEAAVTVVDGNLDDAEIG